jgi:hypothetical protein
LHHHCWGSWYGYSWVRSIKTGFSNNDGNIIVETMLEQDMPDANKIGTLGIGSHQGFFAFLGKSDNTDT